MTYFNAALDIVIVALFGWLLLEATNWAAQWMYERELRRQRQLRIDEQIAAWADADRDFARLQREIREGEK